MDDDTIGERPRFFTPLRLALLWLVALSVYFFTPLSSYVRWLTLDVPTLNGHVDKRIRDNHKNAFYACLYSVTCTTGQAELQIRPSLTAAELDAIRSDIWRRRFETYCPGQTTNFGLEYVDIFGNAQQDIWEFGHGFSASNGHFSGGSFGPLSTTACTLDRAYWTRENGIVANIPKP